jgi:hypothetical protein
MRRVLVLLTVLATACGASGSSPKQTARPTSAAQVRFDSPTSNEVTGPDITIKLVLTGATVVPATKVKGALRGDEGHVHVTVDDQLISMTYGTTQDVKGLKPGPHTISAEFVAIDHQPFANRVLSPPVIFQVR